MIDSYHFTAERSYRKNNINAIGGYGKPIETFYVDRGHKNGAELHTVTTNAIIVIHNAKTLKHCTDLIARPKQIKDLYAMGNREAPQKILDLAYQHVKKGLNY